jgi:drug/metabolite transporter (DMT)-like permease
MSGGAPRAMPVLIGVGCIWGASFLFIKVIVDETGPLETVTGRLFFGMVAVLSFILLTRRRIRTSPPVLARVVMLAVLTNIVPFALIAWSEEHIDSGVASILNATVPIFTALLAAALLDEEHFTAPRVAGLLLGFAGVAVLAGDSLLDITSADFLGQLAVVVAAACYGLGAVVARNLLRDQDPVNLTALQLVIAVPIAFVLTLLARGGSPHYGLSAEAWLSLVALGVGGTGLAYVAYLWLIDNIGSVRASLVTYIIPVVAVALGWIILGESPGLNTLAGGALVIAGVASVLRGQVPARRASRERESAGRSTA